MAKLFWRVTWPALALMLPEVWQDGFTWLRTTAFWPWLQAGVWIWLALALMFSVPWRTLKVLVGFGPALSYPEKASSTSREKESKLKRALGMTPLLCVKSDPPFSQDEIAGFPDTAIEERLASGRWIKVPPSGLRLHTRRVMSALRLGPVPQPILLFSADEHPAHDLFVTVTNYGASVTLAAWGKCFAAFDKPVGAETDYPINWLQTGTQTITLERNESGRLHVVHAQQVHQPNVHYYETLTDWLVVTLLGADGKDADRQFFSHALDGGDGVMQFALFISCLTKPPMDKPATVHYVVSNLRDDTKIRIDRPSTSRMSQWCTLRTIAGCVSLLDGENSRVLSPQRGRGTQHSYVSTGRYSVDSQLGWTH